MKFYILVKLCATKNQVLLKNAEKDYKAVTCFYLQLQAVKKPKIIKKPYHKYKNPRS